MMAVLLAVFTATSFAIGIVGDVCWQRRQARLACQRWFDARIQVAGVIQKGEQQ